MGGGRKILRRAAPLLALWLMRCSCADDPAECEGQQCDGPRDAASSGCASDADCGGAFPFCEQGFCTECRTDDHCMSPTPLCISGNRCGECRTGADCPQCGLCTSRGVCAQCTQQCTDPSPYPCLKNDIVDCCECREDAQCVTHSNRPKCSPEDGVCYQCLVDADCTQGQLCLAHVCYRPQSCACATDADCAACTAPESRVCNNELCQACRTNTDCPGNQFCFDLGGVPLCGICQTNQDCMNNPKFPGFPNCRTDGVCCADDLLANGCIACRNDDDCASNEVCEEREGYITCWPR